jgi:excisionase family DNA binding protein
MSEQSSPSLAERIAAVIAEHQAASEPDAIRPLSYTYKTAAKATGLGINTLRREVRAGRLKRKKVGTKVVITDQELRRWLAECGD